MSFKHYQQHDLMDCGPTCLKMVAKFYGRNCALHTLRNFCQISKTGVSILGISEAAEKIGFHSLGVKLSISQLQESTLPCILHWENNHFVVLYKVRQDNYYIADPAKGLVKYNKEEFTLHWTHSRVLSEGISLLLAPTPLFYEQEDGAVQKGVSWSFLTQYLVTYKRLIIQLLIGLGFTSLLQLITPFLTQSIVDIGINTRNLNFIYIVLIAQLTLFVGSTSVDFIRSWIMLHITTRLNVAILTDFLIKLMKLPMSFFDSKMTGDIMQRMGDQSRIQGFLTGSTLTILFSFFNLIIFAIILAYYNTQIFFIFLVGSITYSVWIILFLSRRKTLDNKHFEVSSTNQSNTIQLISGMQDIKLNNCEQQKRWHWEHIQAKAFKLSVKSLSLGQYQQAGAAFINQTKNILITFLSAKAVIDGDITLGGMMAIQYIVGQLSSPVEQFLGFIQGYQDAKLSLDRLNEIHGLEDEEPAFANYEHELPEDRNVFIRDLTFRYPGAGNKPALQDINLHIPSGKTTAIVGMSGSGKTTILKILLRFYQWESGEIHVGKTKLQQISHKSWRSQCGIVMQEGFIFSDTIANNIAVGDEHTDQARLKLAAELSNSKEFIDELPLGFSTKIGIEGNGLSQGQKQRILIARAIYKNPEYIFFDEATNALDASNERAIMDNLTHFFKGRTVIVVAHRLSTVKNADNIVVMEKGKIIEQGNHKHLISLKGKYFELVKNQLELGN